MLPNWEHRAVLTLPRNWRHIFSGAATKHVYGQLTSRTLRTAFMRYLFAAALEVYSEACFNRCCHGPPIRPQPGLRWQINDHILMLCPTIDDRTLYSCQEVEDELIHYTIITPPDHDGVLKCALRGLVGERKCPTVFSIDSYISWRTTFDGHDLGLDSKEVFIKIIRHYNERVANLRQSSRLLIKVPKKM